MVPKEVEGCQPKHITVEVPIDAPGEKTSFPGIFRGILAPENVRSVRVTVL